MVARSALILAALLIGVVSAAYETANAKIKVQESDFPGGLSLHIYAPLNSGTFPVIWFATGFGADAPVFGYSLLLGAIARKGYVIVGMDHDLPHLPGYIRDGKHFHDIMEWGKDNLAQFVANTSAWYGRIVAKPDVSRSVVMAQSAGNHIIGQALTVGCSLAKASVMIDPVDGYDPFRLIRTQDLIKPGEKVKFTTPALLLSTGLDPVATQPFFPACAPAEISNDHFYNAWRGPIWNINATEYGHVDCSDPPASAFAGIICPSKNTTNKQLYREHLTDAITAFLGAVLDGKHDQLSVLEDASRWKVDVVVKHDLKGMSHSDVSGGCTNALPVPVVV